MGVVHVMADRSREDGGLIPLEDDDAVCGEGEPADGGRLYHPRARCTTGEWRCPDCGATVLEGREGDVFVERIVHA